LRLKIAVDGVIEIHLVVIGYDLIGAYLGAVATGVSVRGIAFTINRLFPIAPKNVRELVIAAIIKFHRMVKRRAAFGEKNAAVFYERSKRGNFIVR
jgi:hypothetical protein